MTDEQAKEIKVGIIALLTVAIQIRNGDKGKPTEEGHLATAQNLLNMVARQIGVDVEF